MKLLKLLIYYGAIFVFALGFYTFLKLRSPYGPFGPHAFAISGSLTNGDTIMGNVQITTRYGSFYGGPVLISGPQSFTLGEVMAGHWEGSQTYVGEATMTQSGCPTLFFDIQTSRVQSYDGGQMTPDSGLKLCDGRYIPIISGALTRR